MGLNELLELIEMQGNVLVIERSRPWQPWMETFLDEYAATGKVGTAASLAGITRQTAYKYRKRCPPFAKAWLRIDEGLPWRERTQA